MHIQAFEILLTYHKVMRKRDPREKKFIISLVSIFSDANINGLKSSKNICACPYATNNLTKTFHFSRIYTSNSVVSKGSLK